MDSEICLLVLFYIEITLYYCYILGISSWCRMEVTRPAFWCRVRRQPYVGQVAQILWSRAPTPVPSLILFLEALSAY